jgi:cytochrome c peroxidase
VGCASCHAPASGYTTRETFALPTRKPPPGYEPDPIPAFKIPALSYLAGRAPYFHDGSAATLAQLIEDNGARMGNTAALTREQRSDLAAFLETL